ncbi:hypothetical protein [Oceanobacillus neutriphilus]|uniref:Lipoprotein n=1 Tax=Oceanobacillus neutriphilus TaxID=531815 RepID=A0ABQ2NS84_9BACI|nr:hypothetical protein [Oceanobacillus neutriphilus]GGP09227.1 hypothetical protein GCM10011346_12450 [Oceanobacillus neutriphilus]
MKKTLLFALALMLGLIVSACTNSSANEADQPDQTNSETSAVESSENEQEESLLPEDYGKENNEMEEAREKSSYEYLKAFINYIDASFGEDLIVDEVVKAKKESTGEKEGQNKIDVKITLNDKFADSFKGLALPHLILTDLVDNKFNEFSKSEVNEVHFEVKAPIDGEETNVYEAEIDEEGYNKIQDEKTGDSIDMNAIIENSKEFWLHDIYEEDIFNGIAVQSVENEDE